MKKRVDYCDFLRFLAILSVILIHVLGDMKDYFLQQNRTYYFILTALDSITRAGVPLFFMFTGIFLLSSKKTTTYFDFIKKTFKKLILPLIFASLIYYTYEVWTQKTSFSIVQFLLRLQSNQIKYHLWYLYSIIPIYLLLPFITVGIQKMNQKQLRNLIILLFILGNVPATISRICFYLNIPTLDSFTYPTLLIYLNYTFLGYYLYHYDIEKKYKKLFYILGIISLICMPILDFLCIKETRWDPFLAPDIVFPFMFTIAVFLYVKENYIKWNISPKLQTFFKSNAFLSLYIYLSHVMILELLQKFILSFFHPTRFIHYLSLVFLYFIGTYILSYIFSYVLHFIMSFKKKEAA